MNREKAYKEMEKGNKVCHKNFMSHEYIFIKDMKILTEDGYDFEERFYVSDLFKEDWSIFEEPERGIKITNVDVPTKSVDLSDLEQGIISSALNAYWNDANEQLERNGVIMYDGVKRPLGDIERDMLIQRMELVKPLLMKFENL